MNICAADVQKGYIEELPKGKTIICVCSDGLRSMRVQDVLLLNGYAAAYLQGGVDALKKMGKDNDAEGDNGGQKQQKQE